jgi:uncharacterized protein (TIGR03437 family)
VTAPWGQWFTDTAGYVVAQHAADYRPVTLEDPARPGEWITVYGSNFGEVLAPPLTGMPAALYPLAPLAPGVPVAWQFGLWLVQPDLDIRLETNFMGLAPGTVGVYQINLHMPDAFRRGDSVQFYMMRIRNCGFFLLPGCGRGVVMNVSPRAKLHSRESEISSE